MAKFIDLTGQTFNQLTVIKELGGSKVLCRCTCGNEVECYKKNVKSGKVKSCGCQNKDYSLFGKTINNLTVIRELGGGKVLCRCICGKTIECWKKNVKSGIVQSCGCVKNDRTKIMVNPSNKYIGAVFGELTVIRSNSDRTVTCRCSCGKEIDTYIQTLNKGHMTTCGHDKLRNTIVGREFGELTVIERLNAQKVKCRCSCGNIKEYYVSHLLNGTARSCGCKKLEHSRQTMLERYGDTSIKLINKNKNREPWQIEVIQSKENLENYLKSLGGKVEINTLKELLGLTQPSVSRIINKYKLNGYIKYASGFSNKENELLEYIKTIYKGDVITHDRSASNNEFELDIYIPEKKIAFEFNGNYWHSNIFKDEEYHQYKTLKCTEKGIRLIHIFEYEWDNNSKIKSFINSSLNGYRNKIYARNTVLKEVNKEKTKEFLNKNHLQGYSSACINIVLYENDKIVALMSFDKPRFNNKYQYELIRLAFDNDTVVIGGAEKMFKHFCDTFNPNSIISYCDLGKFTGNIYLKLGFKPIEVTKPNYVWWMIHTSKVLNRYQTQKHRLIELGLGNEEQSEDEIMESLDYCKIYNSGNLKLLWNKEDVSNGNA